VCVCWCETKSEKEEGESSGGGETKSEKEEGESSGGGKNGQSEA